MNFKTGRYTFVKNKHFRRLLADSQSWPHCSDFQQVSDSESWLQGGTLKLFNPEYSVHVNH